MVSLEELTDTRGEVWVFAEQEEGRLHEVSLELLSKGRELADTLGVRLGSVLLGWEVLLTVFVINKVLDCDAVLSFILAAVICAATVQFYNRIYRLTERLLPGQERVHMEYRGR